MQPMRSVARSPGLGGVVAAASPASVLNLHALAAESQGDPDDDDQPLFSHPVLNRSIIVKHNVGPAEADRLTSRRPSATKIIFPFDFSDLSLGGQCLFVDQRNFIGSLTRHLDYTGLPLERDMAVLGILDKLPTFDPFLVREFLDQQQIEVGRRYLRFCELEKAEMTAFVAGEIEALIQICFGERQGNDLRTRRLSQLLLANPRSGELRPLRETLRMDLPEFSEAMFAWKAFLYYRWRARVVAPLLQVTLRSISTIRSGWYGRDEVSFVARAKHLLQQTITSAWRDVSQSLKGYDGAFASLNADGDPQGLRSFLTRDSRLFVELGDLIGRLAQVASFWDNRFGDQPIAVLPPDDVRDGLRDLLQVLSIDLRAQPRPRLRPAEEAPL